MSLIKKWESLIESKQTSEEYNQFWNEYIPKEQSIYEYILDNSDEKIQGKVSDLASKFEIETLTFVGFLDGINSSLKTEINLEEIAEDSEISLDIDFEKLLFNMYKAKAKWLYTLSNWSNVFSDEKRDEIEKSFNQSKIFVNSDKKVGRNDPCPCGSGKKYKKCCINK